MCEISRFNGLCMYMHDCSLIDQHKITHWDNNWHTKQHGFLLSKHIFVALRKPAMHAVIQYINNSIDYWP